MDHSVGAVEAVAQEGSDGDTKGQGASVSGVTGFPPYAQFAGGGSTRGVEPAAVYSVRRLVAG